jgi:hypothetical protein
MKLKNYFFTLLALAFAFQMDAQQSEPASDFGMLPAPVFVPSIADQLASGTFIPAENRISQGHPKLRHGNVAIAGQGMPLGDDPLIGTQALAPKVQTRELLDTFIADISSATPSDPTGAVGPNHYVAAWNSAFRIFDKTGTPLTAEASLATLFPGNAIGDPIIFYDAQADRFVITEFDNNPNGFNVAVCQGPDPVNDGWHVYTTGFGTGSFPDYTKFAVWGDSYVVTANIGAANRVFAVERNEMLNGDPAQFVAFPLPGIATFGFYSPHAFHTTDENLAPIGTPAPIVYLQDDAWGGISDDHLKVWSADIVWANVGSSSISAAQEITTADFTAVFDNGSFQNRPQGGGVDVDILQATMMNQVQYRRFSGYNSVVMNFVVDVLAGGAEKAAVRWYELRQDADGDPWTIFQEGTYEAPDGRDAYSASMAMNADGEIGMAYTSSSATDRISIQYTGQTTAAASGIMDVEETLIAQSTGACPNPGRLADYVQLSVDPVDQSFWHIAEYYEPTRRDVVGHFDFGTTAGVDDVNIANSDFIISSLPNNQFDVTLRTGYEGEAQLSVFDLQGKELSNQTLSKNGDSFNHTLDMAYATTGVYLVRIGNQGANSFQTAKIIVK